MASADPAVGTPGRRASRLLRIAGLAAAVLSAGASIGRALVMPVEGMRWIWYIALGVVFVTLFAITVWRAPLHTALRHLVLAAECLIVLALLLLNPERDFLTGMLAPLAFLAAIFFPARTCWLWVTALALLTIVPLTIDFGPLHGLSLSLTTVAIEVALAACVLVIQEIEAARRESQIALRELEESQRRLREYASQAGDLATVRQRGQVARDLNDSLARTLAAIRAITQQAENELAGDASGADGEEIATDDLARLQTQTQSALAQMRTLIAELRPVAE